MPYPINPDRNIPWNDLPELPDILNTKDAIRQVILDDTAITRPELLVNAIFTQPFTRESI